jgi:hypothetical protein
MTTHTPGGLPLAARDVEAPTNEAITSLCRRVGSCAGANAKTIGLFLASISFGLSLSILVAQCAFFGNYWPLISLVVYALLPLTYGVLSLFPWLQSISDIVDAFGSCLAGAALSTLLALPFVFYRNGLIATTSEILVLYLANAISLFGTSAAIILFQLSHARVRRTMGY